MTRYEEGSLLRNRLGAEGVTDQGLAVVLLHFWQGCLRSMARVRRRLMLIDRGWAKAITAREPLSLERYPI